MIRLSLTLSREADGRLERLAHEAGTSKANILRYGITLLKLAHEAKAQGQHFGIAKPDAVLEKEIVW